MHWKFDPFFSIEILHGKYPPPGVGQPAPPAPVFSVTPTGDTQKRLLQMGWVFKPYTDGGGGILYAEKTVAPDGTAKLRVKPAQNEGFTFVVGLNDPSLLRETKPYMRPPTQAEIDAEPDPIKKNAPRPTEQFPPFSGRARVLYFNNLNATASGPDTFSLTAGSAVGFAEFASRLPTDFMFRTETSGVTKVEMTTLAPGGTPIPFPLNTTTQSAEIKLPENGYGLAPKPVGQSETVFLTDESLPTNTLGVLRIFQPPGADWEPFRHYQIMFDKA